MAEPLVVAPDAHAAVRDSVDARLRAVASAVAAAVRGGVAGLAVVTFLAAAYAGLNLHIATPVGDALIGVLLVALPLGLAVGVLTVVTRLLRVALRRRRFAAARPIPERWPARPGRPGIVLPVVVGCVLVALVWLMPEDGPLAMYRSLATFEILIVTGAIVGALIGTGRHLLRAHEARSPRIGAFAAYGVAGILTIGVGSWAALPGFGDPIIRESSTAVGRIAPLEISDPSLPGVHTVATATYGSDVAWRRPEFGSEADWRTPTVDASGALEERTGVAGVFGQMLWGHGPEMLPINGSAWYPSDINEPAPLVLIVHGNHAAGDFSDPGYEYLAAHLASHGMIAVSVDENYLNGDAFFDYRGYEQGVRAWMLLRHVQQFAEWNADADHPLAGLVDLDRVALIGHSRGGEAAAVAAAMEAGSHGVAGLPPVPRGFGIRSVIGIAPSDGQYRGPGGLVRLDDVDYLVIQGAHDGDLPAFSGLATYHRTELNGAGHLKVAVYSERANHGRFNTVWDVGDAGPLASWMLDRGSILSIEEQQHLAKTVIGAFLARSLFARTEYDAFFRDPRAGRSWLPDDVVLSEWATSDRLVLADFGSGAGEGTHFQGFDESTVRDPGLRDGSMQGDRAVRLTWSGPASLTVPVEPRVALQLSTDASLVFSLVAAEDALPTGPIVHVHHVDGLDRSVALDDVMPTRPLLPTRLWKVDGLGDRYLPEEKLDSPVERFLQTYEIPLSAFGDSLGEAGTDGIRGIVIAFDGQGSAYIDDIGFEPG